MSETNTTENIQENSKYTVTIGLEIHAELSTNSKMFCHSKNDADEDQPNVNVCPICMGHPGTLPTINQQAIEHMIKIGLSVGGDIANFTEFDRKNYFYPDIPKGYQITQFAYPIVSGGKIGDIEITRIHLEEDTGLSKHDRGDFSLVDFNRAGVPLMELVTEPVIHSAAQASIFAKSLQSLLRYLGVGHANMEKGEMRVEANISISDTDELGTKVEVKNLNSFRSVERAIEYEVDRMTRLCDAGKKDEIIQETRGWDENKNKTFSQRVKETSDDYRYFPEPDLPKLKLHELFDITAIKETLPELPWEHEVRLRDTIGLNDETIFTLLGNRMLGVFYDEVFEALGGMETVSKDKKMIQLAANYITSDLVALSKEESFAMPTVEQFTEVITMTNAGDISSRGAKDILAVICGTSEANTAQDITSIKVAEYAKEHGLVQENDTEAIRATVQSILSEQPDAVAEFKSGKESAIQFLIGQGMRATKGSANPQVLKQIFEEELGVVFSTSKNT